MLLDDPDAAYPPPPPHRDATPAAGLDVVAVLRLLLPLLLLLAAAAAAGALPAAPRLAAGVCGSVVVRGDGRKKPVTNAVRHTFSGMRNRACGPPPSDAKPVTRRS